MNRLNLKAGEWVEVRSQGEILGTLGRDGRLDNMPFMPEMFQLCGRRIRVAARADKTCDPAHEPWSIRRVKDAVHLEDARCDGSSHGGCQAGCMIFWKEAWLKRVGSDDCAREAMQPAGTACTVSNLLDASRSTQSGEATVYSCQATAIRDYTMPMASWDPRQYVRDLSSGNLASGLAADSRTGRALELFLALIRLFRAFVIWAFNRIPVRLSGGDYPFVTGSPGKTPAESLGLQDGELVQVRGKEEIMATLDNHHRNRGMLFDAEMLPYCGGIYKVRHRVYKLIDERSGKMVEMKNPCIILDDVVCKSEFHRFCPRAIYPYWRENWLKRVAAEPGAMAEKQVANVSERS